MEPNATLSLYAPTDPDPHTWLTEERREKLIHLTASVRPLLVQAGLWRATLVYWVREQASLEVAWDSLEEQKTLDDLEEQWRSKAPSDSQKLDQETLRAKLRVKPASIKWSRTQWGHRLESLYLQSKSQLDRASCRVVRLSGKPLATELYHRIKAGETPFAEVAREFGEGPERHKDGLIPLRPLGSMPFGLAPVLERLKCGQISQPMRLGKGFCLVELIEFQISQLDQETEEALLGDQLRLWIDRVVDEVEATLRWPEH